MTSRTRIAKLEQWRRGLGRLTVRDMTDAELEALIANSLAGLSDDELSAIRAEDSDLGKFLRWGDTQTQAVTR